MVRVLNHFDDGGWLDFGFWIARSEPAFDSRFKTFIDGRTSLAGEERFKDFEKIEQLKDDWCGVLELWRPDLAILQAKMQLVSVLRQSRLPLRGEESACAGGWKLLFADGPYVVLAPRQQISPFLGGENRGFLPTIREYDSIGR